MLRPAGKPVAVKVYGSTRAPEPAIVTGRDRDPCTATMDTQVALAEEPPSPSSSVSRCARPRR